MIITISGVPGSGKTSVGKLIAKNLGMNFYSVGDLRGKMAVERGMTIDQLNALGEKEAFTDTDADNYQGALGGKEDQFVIEGRLSWHFIPHSFKVLLLCDPKEAARRIFSVKQNQTEKADRHDEPEYDSLEHTEQSVAKRTASDVLRYQKYYGIDYRDPSQYDLVIDTTQMPGPEVTTQKILESLPKNPS